ncbi:MAG: hypothetical protein ACREV7_14885 [Steroidobacteraceae bacterium]
MPRANAEGPSAPVFDADIMALPGNPLKNIHATEHPVLAMKNGVIYRGV